ncbi:TetR/AcrR family transcriptional regulator [Phytoactinopolyspora mesophila]|uniref:TetR family transcriptional regulator n=1 Tax=Phytoactinopolyspora mesophila TaxID=2650750 RepID=A0A7K3M0J0_9ACTN|nr:TetR/AcrR family transcriptional regulator [Phytoactinopolyspora mesophila]NDL56813.1 TetR family transcriptional regulator [Phytoactinopolyspora mesophila]
MREWIPVPGSAKARLVESALHHFERFGFETASVGELAAKAGVTTGSLYHHFGSKLGLYLTVRDDVERRIGDRMEGAAESAGGTGRPAVRAALTVAFDAAVRFDVCRLVGEPPVAERPDRVELTVRGLLPDRAGPTALVLAAAWRTALLSVADGATSTSAREALEFVLAD